MNTKWHNNREPLCRARLLHRLATLIFALGLACTAFCPAFSGENQQTGRVPNIVLILADDFGYECVAANGGESYETPHLDQLAASGVRFEQCHTTPLCTPTRVQLMTGQYNVRNYIRFGLLPRDQRTFAQVLKQAGYATAVCGKWQLGSEQDSPQHFGFDESCLWQQTRRPPRYANPGLEYNGVEKDFHSGEYGPKLVNDFALEFVQRQVTGHPNRPFFLYYPMILTHNPFQPTPDSANWDPKAVGEKVNHHVKNFADNVKYMDKMVGRLVAKLEELKVRDNTLLIFVGDNGTNGSVTSRFRGRDYQGGKGTTTERGTHVPLIANWPAAMGALEPASRVKRDLISTVDVLPTLCAAAGVAAPTPLDGVSFLPQLQGQAGSPRETLYCWYSPRQQANLNVREFAMTHTAKLYRSGEFYDLASDPFEKTAISHDKMSHSQRLAAQTLQRVLDQYSTARSAALDRALGEKATRAKQPGQKKTKQK
jgi:arylsulfatase A